MSAHHQKSESAEDDQQSNDQQGYADSQRQVISFDEITRGLSLILLSFSLNLAPTLAHLFDGSRIRGFHARRLQHFIGLFLFLFI